MSHGMSEYLAEFYGTTGTPKTASAPTEEEDLLKQAQVELFCKVAAGENIDLASMPDEQVEQLFTNFVKNASEPTIKMAEEDGDKKKKDEAEKELEEKKASAQEFAKYDFFGRQMAHAYVDEMKKIAAAASEKDAEFPPKKEDEEHEKEDEKEERKEKKEAAMPEGLRKGLDWVKGHAGKAGGAIKGTAGKVKEHAGKAYDATKEHVGKHRGAYGAGAGVAAGAGGAHAAHKFTKKSSAIDELALERAVVKAAEAGYDVDEAATRLNAAYTLDLFEESTKIAGAGDVTTAIEIRALEMLEAARYPITWADGVAA